MSTYTVRSIFILISETGALGRGMSNVITFLPNFLSKWN
jgi:hypothetical protein